MSQFYIIYNNNNLQGSKLIDFVKFESRCGTSLSVCVFNFLKDKTFVPEIGVKCVCYFDESNFFDGVVSSFVEHDLYFEIEVSSFCLFFAHSVKSFYNL